MSRDDLPPWRKRPDRDAESVRSGVRDGTLGSWEPGARLQIGEAEALTFFAACDALGIDRGLAGTQALREWVERHGESSDALPPTDGAGGPEEARIEVAEGGPFVLACRAAGLAYEEAAAQALREWAARHAPVQGRRWLLNSAVITAEGTWTYRRIDRDAAAEWLRAGPAESRIGYPQTADHLRDLCGTRPAISREASPMEPGDEALVVRLPYRVQDPASKGAQQADPQWEYGILRRVSGAE